MRQVPFTGLCARDLGPGAAGCTRGRRVPKTSGLRASHDTEKPSERATSQPHGKDPKQSRARTRLVNSLTAASSLIIRGVRGSNQHRDAVHDIPNLESLLCEGSLSFLNQVCLDVDWRSKQNSSQSSPPPSLEINLSIILVPGPLRKALVAPSRRH